MPAKVFTEDSPTKAALKSRVSSLEAVAHELFEENQDVKESLEGLTKKHVREVRKSLFHEKKKSLTTSLPLVSAARGCQ